MMSCDACRAFHYKCDDSQPSCTRCAKVGRRCVRNQERFRFKDEHATTNKFPRSQRWVSSTSKVVFVGGHASPTEHETEGEVSATDDLSPPIQSASLRHIAPDVSDTDASLPMTAASWSFVNTAQKARLLRHFIDNVAHFFDFCDPDRHFARLVPHHARSSGVLSSAMFALSARHLSRVSSFDAAVADVHYQSCLQQLIPALAENAHDGLLLIAIVVLRLMEELDVPITGEDSQNHLFGTRAIVRAQEQQFSGLNESSGVLRAAYWAALRQDLYISLSTQRPMQLSSLDLVRTGFETGKANDSDARWANLAVLQCCDVCQLVFGRAVSANAAFESLETSLEDWDRDKPSSFQPFYTADEFLHALPDIKYLADWHVMGHMYNLLSKLLLIMYRPDNLHAVSSSMNANETMARDAQQIVWTMAGIAVSNPQTPSAMLVASMAIALGCDRSDIISSSPILHQLLQDTENRLGWPTLAARRKFRPFTGGLR